MEIRKARIEELQEIMHIYEIGRGFMRQTGNFAQWGGGYPSEELVRSDIEAGDCYVAAEGESLEAVFAFHTRKDPTYQVIEDGAWLNEDQYGVLHRIASAGRVKGVGSQCIQWCFSQWPNLRGDTHADNHVMQHVLEKNGFVKCGRIYVEDGSPRIAYQKVR